MQSRKWMLSPPSGFNGRLYGESNDQSHRLFPTWCIHSCLWCSTDRYSNDYVPHIPRHRNFDVSTHGIQHFNWCYANREEKKRWICMPRARTTIRIFDGTRAWWSVSRLITGVEIWLLPLCRNLYGPYSCKFLQVAKGCTAGADFMAQTLLGNWLGWNPSVELMSGDYFLRVCVSFLGRSVSITWKPANSNCSTITDSPSNIQRAENIVLVCAAGVMIPAFLGWMNWRERSGKSALIPNSLWKNTAFASVCVMVLLSWAVLNGMETILSLL